MSTVRSNAIDNVEDNYFRFERDDVQVLVNKKTGAMQITLDDNADVGILVAAMSSAFSNRPKSGIRAIYDAYECWRQYVNRD